MKTNFSFLSSTPDFASFADVAVSAERLLHIDVDACVLNCRRAMEFAVKWMYTVDRELVMPRQDNLVTLINDGKFREIIGDDVWQRMDFIRKLGNNAAHGDKKVTMEQAELCLENLFVFMDCVAYFYAPEYTEQQFDRSLLELTVDEALSFVPDNGIRVHELIEENKALRDELTARRTGHQQAYVPKPLDRSGYKIYVDFMLADAGWTEGVDLQLDVALYGKSKKAKAEYADYVLFGDDGRPLAVLETKYTCTDAARGKKQAKRCADRIEQQYGRRPLLFLSNGFDTRIWDGANSPERRVASVYSKRDLEKHFRLQTARTSLQNVKVDKRIAGRYYQKKAVRAVCESFDRENRRKALLTMAAGSGKTRTVIALCKVLAEHGWAENFLFLSDRSSLALQAKREFGRLLPNFSAVNLCETGENADSRCVFATYTTMMNSIDTVKDENGRKLFTGGHFDLVIVDEAHRSIYNKYKDIFNYFDAPLVGLTAAPRDEIDAGTYKVFGLENGTPTYAYDLAQAVADGFLVNFTAVESNLKFASQETAYDDLSAAEKEAYENTFQSEDGELPDTVASAAIHEWIFSEDTIRRVLHILMNDGLKIEHGKKLGKTILFAKNRKHAEKILDIFRREFPHLPGYAAVIGSDAPCAQRGIDAFSDPKKLPQIAISVDALDTGIDIPHVLNLVFFKKVRSKAKFWQMIGRGTRRCAGLMDGKDKEKFYIFDFCGNFAFFRMNDERPAANPLALPGAVFRLQAQLAFTLQSETHRTADRIAFRRTLTDDLVRKVRELNRENFAVRQHLRCVERFAEPDTYHALTYEDTLQMTEELAPLIRPDDDDASAVRFDVLMYGIELAYLAEKPYPRGHADLLQTVRRMEENADIPEIRAQSELIRRILHTDYPENADIPEWEHIRNSLRKLIQHLPGAAAAYSTGLYDEILSEEQP